MDLKGNTSIKQAAIIFDEPPTKSKKEILKLFLKRIY
tara:strand:+ start:404 stop:514 length:111 start_codon:yes stop_codon:yes gene_type:complete